MQLTQVYVQKSTRTTLPRCSSKVIGSELIQLAMPLISGTVFSLPVAGVTMDAWADACGSAVATGFEGTGVALSVGGCVGGTLVAVAACACCGAGAAGTAFVCCVCAAGASVVCGADPEQAAKTKAAASSSAIVVMPMRMVFIVGTPVVWSVWVTPVAIHWFLGIRLVRCYCVGKDFANLYLAWKVRMVSDGLPSMERVV